MSLPVRAALVGAVLVGAALVAAPVFAAAPQCPDGAPPPCAGRAARDAPTSVAVLYFENLSRDTNDLYLADGLTEELTSRLGAVTRLRVTGRSVVRRAQQTTGGDVLALGRSLNVRYLVEGSLRRAGSRVRISARLLRASDGVRVWGDDYDRTMDDLLAMQVDIAQEVAQNVAGQLLPGEQRSLARRPTTNAGAYDHYLRARYLLNRRTEAAMTQAAVELDQALRLDSLFAKAEARRAMLLTTAWGYGVSLAPLDSLAVWAPHSAARAMRLDPQASDSWLARATTQLFFQPHDVAAARSAAERAIAIDPRNPDAHHFLGVILGTVPDPAAAIASFQRALALEPGRGVSLLNIAQYEYAERRYPSARRWADSAIAVDPQQARAFMVRSLARLRLADTAGAAHDGAAAYQLSSGTIRTQVLASMIALSVARGDTAAARSLHAEMERGVFEPMALAWALISLGRLDEALALIEHGPLIPADRHWLPWPEFDTVRSLPRFTRAIARWTPPGARNP